ncbi:MULTISPECIES: hypothetical protein [unclassified Leisingera]|uniref:hypothetical protein n=1 Tax=unclassified Leisingera TaxID=2614906 RepID=UPI00101189CA|nr:MULTISPECIES: hypothetical protein [unclassified Leisingera]MBQ4824132.1 hypothetical protein [Leisingera sp. HS039]QAX29106.1 hypothetical protein ETW24_06910 [Leisingera sp. NJS204]QBR36891.1 hypothetical protein ETW23_12835 [Leisingera sp. NJS201]
MSSFHQRGAFSALAHEWAGYTAGTQLKLWRQMTEAAITAPLEQMRAAHTMFEMQRKILGFAVPQQARPETAMPQTAQPSTPAKEDTSVAPAVQATQPPARKAAERPAAKRKPVAKKPAERKTAEQKPALQAAAAKAPAGKTVPAEAAVAKPEVEKPAAATANQAPARATGKTAAEAVSEPSAVFRGSSARRGSPEKQQNTAQSAAVAAVTKSFAVQTPAPETAPPAAKPARSEKAAPGKRPRKPSKPRKMPARNAVKAGEGKE